MRPPQVIDTNPVLKRKVEMVESLAEIEIATNLLKSTTAAQLTQNPLDSQYESLKCLIDPLSKDDDLFDLIQKYVQNTHAETHQQYQLEIEDVFVLDRNGEAKSFVADSLKNRKLLWHGSRLTNYVGILSQGLRIAPPEAPSTGYMFGKGVYFADMVSKSANYCYTSQLKNSGLLLLCDVALGDECSMDAANYDAHVEVKKNKKHSTKGCGSTCPNPKEDIVLDDGVVVPCGKPVKIRDKKSLLYNEYIVYDTKQVKMKYLVKVKFLYKR